MKKTYNITIETEKELNLKDKDFEYLIQRRLIRDWYGVEAKVTVEQTFNDEAVLKEGPHFTFLEFCTEMQVYNEQREILQQFSDKMPIYGVIVFKNESWPNRKENYSLQSRSYVVRSDNKYFLPTMIGNSLYGDNLDNTDKGVRLDWMLHDEDTHKAWIIDYCYFL